MLKPLNYNSLEPINLITNALLNGLEGWIGQEPSMQNICPAAFYSWKFKQADMNYTVTEKEILAIIDSLRHFTPQLTATKFTILTDNKASVSSPNTTNVVGGGRHCLTTRIRVSKSS